MVIFGKSVVNIHMIDDFDEEEEDLTDDELSVRNFEDGVTFVESLVSLTHGEKRVTPANMMICLMDDGNLRKLAIEFTKTKTWVMFVRRAIRHYGLRNGTWVAHLRKWKCRDRTGCR